MRAPHHVHEMMGTGIPQKIGTFSIMVLQAQQRLLEDID